jgi:Zn-dependent protease
VTEIILSLLSAVLAITLHEAAHGYAALAMGDDTAKVQGRLSLNPLAHVDRVGTILVPGGLWIVQKLMGVQTPFLFGWAKPVPIAAWRFRDPRRGMMIVAAAGPAMNFVLAWLTGLALHLVPYMTETGGDLLEQFGGYFILFNLVLGLFNLLPIPPLDGGRILVGLLPERAAMGWAKIERFGIVAVLLLVFLLPRLAAEFGIAFDPVGTALNRGLPRAIELVLRLSGHG